MGEKAVVVGLFALPGIYCLYRAFAEPSDSVRAWGPFMIAGFLLLVIAVHAWQHYKPWAATQKEIDEVLKEARVEES